MQSHSVPVRRRHQRSRQKAASLCIRVYRESFEFLANEKNMIPSYMSFSHWRSLCIDDDTNITRTRVCNQICVYCRCVYTAIAGQCPTPKRDTTNGTNTWKQPIKSPPLHFLKSPQVLHAQAADNRRYPLTLPNNLLNTAEKKNTGESQAEEVSSPSEA